MAAPSDGVAGSHAVTSEASGSYGGGLSHDSNSSILSSSNASILLIEDNPDVVEYLAACLEKNYALDFAYNGRAGIEKALETIPDLIISDVMMPEKDGFEVCDTLKNDERTSHIPIILLTAKADVQSRIAGLRRGADAYLSKPFHQEELLVTLANLLEVRKKLQARYSKMDIGNWKSEISLSSPAQSSLPPHPSLDDTFMHKVRATVLEHLSDSSFGVDELSRALAISQSQLHRKLVALTGRNTSQTIRYVRLVKARELLLAQGLNVSEAAYEVGFDDPKYFSRVFADEFGVAPSKLAHPDPPAR